MHTKLIWVGRVISGLIALLLTMSAVMKLVGGQAVMEGFTHMGLPDSLRVPLGLLEFSCVVIYLLPASSITGAILLTGYVGGAIVTTCESMNQSSCKSPWGCWSGLACTCASNGSRR